MKLFTTNQIAAIDQYTIFHEPISDIDLMERAATAIFNLIYSQLKNSSKVIFFAGPGNNGGDALAVARMFADKGIPCHVFILKTGKGLSASCQINYERLVQQNIASIKWIETANDFPYLSSGIHVIEGLFGSGLTRPLEGLPASLVRHINKYPCRVYSIDIPGGLLGENNPIGSDLPVIKAYMTITLQFPKISMLFAENEVYTGRVHVVEIGLHPNGMEAVNTPYEMISLNDTRKLIPQRTKFSHKGNFGHALLIAGSYGKMGAAVLSSEACLRTGAGLLTAHIPKCGYTILQAAVPETMCSVDDHHDYFTEVPPIDKYNAIGIGPGLDFNEKTAGAFKKLLSCSKIPMVLDADVLNILSTHPEWLELLHSETILTPHPGEFRRLFGNSANSWERLQLLREKAVKHQIIIILKGAYTAVALPSGKVFFNPTGNPGMATAGSGDVLTGIILGFLAQGSTPADAAKAAVFLHGLAGDLAVSEKSMPAMVASDIINQIGNAYKSIIDVGQSDF